MLNSRAEKEEDIKGLIEEFCIEKIDLFIY